MLSILSIIAPVFALMASGYAVRRLGVAGPAAVSELNRLVVYLALPALLFDIMAHASWSDLAQVRFIAAFGLACGVVFYGTLGLALLRGRPLGTASLDGLLGSYANTAYIGFPVLFMLFGSDSLVPVTIASILTVCVLFASAIVVIEVDNHSDRHLLRLPWTVLSSLARNPLLVAPLAGVAYGATGLGLAPAAETFLKMLGGAASPLALVALGLFLAEPRAAGAAPLRASLRLAAVKLVVHPALTLAFALALAVPPKLTAMAVLLAALPTGTGPFMLAEFYRRPAAPTSAVILLSTLGALVTLPVCMVLLGLDGALAEP